MNLLVTLEAARVNAGFKVKDAAPMLGVHLQTLYSYEKDSSNVPHSFIEKAEKLYKIPKGNIFFGNRFEFIRSLREESE